MEELIEFMRQQGMGSWLPVCDGKIHRFSQETGKDNLWFIGFQNHAIDSGEPYIIAKMGDWKTGSEIVFSPKGSKISKDEMDLFKKKIAAAREKAEQDRIESQDKAAEKAAKEWENLRDNGPTAYTVKKKVTALKGTKRDNHNNLVIPTRDVEGKLWGLQRIAETGSKRFAGGQRVKGCVFIFGEIEEKGGELYLCEGWATGATIHMATNKVTACAFNAGNLVDAARAVKTKYPLLRITVCGDADEVGREKAAKAGEICQGAVVFPMIKEGQEGTDFNDMGVAAVKAMFEDQADELVEDHGYTPLGFAGTTHYFYRRATKDIFCTATFTDVHMFNLAPRSHWAARFENKTGIDWAGAKDHLVEISLAVGPFDASRVRGTGVWLDEGRTIVNSGYEFIVDGSHEAPSRFRSHYIYIQTANRFPITTEPPLTVAECKPILAFADQIAFAREGIDGSLLVGWLAIARIGGALPIRPHLWITGGRGTGKSTLMEQFIYPLLGGPQAKIYVQGGSTEAGIRQILGASSRPLIMDEAEITGPKSRILIEGIIDLHRQAWSPSRGTVVKGSALGTAVEFTLSYCALMASIRVGITNDADKSRISVLELQKPKLSVAEMAAMLEPINELMGERLFRRACAMVGTVRESYKVLFKAIAATKGNRVAQQYAMLLAGAWMLQSDDVITRGVAEQVVGDIRFNDMASEEDPDEDCDDCLEHLLTSKVRLTCPGMASERTISEVIGDDKIWEWHALRNYGIVFEGSDHLIVSDSHAELKKLFSTTHWLAWARSLRRIDGAERVKSVTFDKGLRQRATKVPIQDKQMQR